MKSIILSLAFILSTVIGYSQISSNIDEYGTKTTYTPLEEDIAIMMVDNPKLKSVGYVLILSITDTRTIYSPKGATITFENDYSINKPTLPIVTKKMNNGDIRYDAFIPITDDEAELFLTTSVKSIQVSELKKKVLTYSARNLKKNVELLMQ